MITGKFEEQVGKTPRNIALKTEGESFTYEELNRYANRVAHLVLQTLKQKETVQRVSLLFEHGPHMIAAILGVLKAGKAYVPLSTDYPGNRLSYMIENSGSALVLTLSAHEETARSIARGANIPYITIDSVIETLPGDNPGIDIPGDRLAYIMYTSGSTGRPKGVMQVQENVLYYIRNWTRLFSITREDRMTLFSSFCHDGSVQDMFAALLNGAALYPIDVRRQESFELSEFLAREKITIWHSVHSLFSYFASTLTGEEDFPALRFILLGGEPIREYEINMCKKFFPHSILTNVYGQTESSVNTTWLIRAGDTIEHLLIGEPLDNTRIFVLDEEGSEVDEYAVGEIMAACPHISPGYWKDEEASKKIFERDEEFGLLYFTGDLGRLLPGGNIEFMGRRDAQVKLRGFRIELAEIESALLKHPGIDEAVVAAKEVPAANAGDTGSGDKYLCAYIVSKSSKSGPDAVLDTTGLREFAGEELPDYMIPTYFVFLDRLPLTQSGKIDRKALPDPEISSEEQYAAPRDHIEEKLVDIWHDVLGAAKEKIGIDSDFFELGGHSLRGTTMLSKVHREFNVQIPVAKIFQISTIRGLAEYIKAAGKDKFIPIRPVSPKGYYPVSPMQKRLFILNEIENIHTAYNIKTLLQVEGNLDYPQLEKAFGQMVSRHESLRTSFSIEEEEPVQAIRKKVDFKIEFYDVPEAGRTPGTGENSVDEIIKKFVRIFDLSQAPLLRAGLIKIGETRHILLIDTHHIVFDGTSRMIFLQELLELYAGGELPPLKIQYKDYSEWLNSDKKRDSIKKQEQYWLEQFAGEIPVLDLPADYKRPPLQVFSGRSLRFGLEPKESKMLRELALKEGATLYMVLLAILNVLLSKLSGREDIIIGTPAAGRAHPDIQGTIGLFVNTLANRNYPRAERSFIEFLREVKEKSLRGFENQEYQFEELIEKIEVSRDVSRNPLFDVMFAFQNIEFTELEIPGLKIGPYEHKRDTTIVDLNVQAYEANDELFFVLDYCTALFKQETIERFIKYFKRIVTSLVKNAEKKIAGIEIISAEEKRQLLHEFNDTAVDYPRDKTVHELFEEQVTGSPGKIAVVETGFASGFPHMPSTGGSKTPPALHSALTYKELDRRADRLAAALNRKGAGPGTIVGIMVFRSIEMITGLFAILKAGSGYLPIEPGYPAARKEYLLKDSGAKLLLTTRELSEAGAAFKNPGFETMFFDSRDEEKEIPSPGGMEPGRDISEPAACGSRPIPNTGRPLAYVIYTSGSTGKPKGVMIEHRSVVNRLNWMQKAYPLDEQDVILQKTTFVFDVSVWELFWWSMVGCTVCLLEPGGEKSPESIVEAVERSRVTTMHFVPSMLAVFLEYCENYTDPVRLSGLRQVFASGEALLTNHVERFNSLFNQGNGIRLINLYGPTEATVDVSYYNCNTGENVKSIPIGKPIDNIRLYIVDKGLHLQPIGLAGELCIAGDGLARGYLNRPGLTAENFVESPFIPGDILYKTGDLANWLPDGNVEFTGRIDHQVKIRGFRIELGEIEENLLSHKDIKEAVLITGAAAKGDKYLCAYIVSRTSGIVDTAELREYLSQKLPDYMVPSYFMQLERIPLTPNGKVNRKALPEPEIKREETYAAPRDKIEEQLVEIWSKVLNIEPSAVGIDDNFFELGGHSLKATIMIPRIHKALKVRLPLSVVFRVPNIRGLAEYIKEAAKGEYVSIKSAGGPGFYAISSIQERLFILNEIEGIETAYNLRNITQVEGQLDYRRLQETFIQLVQRHESLRTSFTLREDMINQVVHDTADFKIEHYELTGKSDWKPGVKYPGIDEIIGKFVRPFDLSRPPLLRVGLIKTAADAAAHILMIDIHHIIADGTSVTILLREFLDLYEGKELLPLKIHYKDYSEWLALPEQQAVLKKQEDYWLRLFKGGVPRLENFIDYVRPPVQDFAGDRINMEFDKNLTSRVNQMARVSGATLYMVLLAIYNTLLFKYTGREDMVIGTPTAGRVHNDIENVIGLFINVLVMRNFPAGNKTFAQFLHEVKANTTAAYENRDYPFGDLMEKLGIKNDVSRNPIYDLELVLQNMEFPQLKTKNLTFSPYPFETNTAQVDAALYVVEQQEKLHFFLIYSTGLFKRETMERFIAHFKETTLQVVENKDIKLQDIVISHDLDKAQAGVYEEMAGDLDF